MRQVSVFAFVLLSILVLAAGCDSSDDNSPDGDFEAIEQDQDEAAPICDDAEIGCSGTVAIVCRDGNWEDLADCADDGRTCEHGECVDAPIDGDEDTDIEQEPDRDFEEPPDTDPPQVVNTSPNNGDSGIDINIGQILINFDEELNPNNFLPQRDITFRTSVRNVFFLGSLENNSRQIRMTFDLLEEGRKYTVTVAENSIADLAGNLFGGISFSFTTEGYIDGDEEDITEEEIDDTTAPTVQGTSPENGQTDIAPGIRDVLVIFSEPMDLTGFPIDENVSMMGDDNHHPDYNAYPQNGDRHLLIRLNEQLHFGTTYTIDISEGLHDKSGNPLGAFSFHFTIMEAPDGDTDSDPDLPQTGQMDGTPRLSNCLANPPDYTPDSYPPSLEAEWKTDYLEVTHHNAGYPYCLDAINVDNFQAGSTISWTEDAVIPGACEEVCPFDIQYRLIYLVPGSYTIRVTPDDGAPALETTVVIP